MNSHSTATNVRPAMVDVMLDLETFGVGSDAAIVSIGAVQFDAESGRLGSEFYTVIDPQSCVDRGLRIDAGTVLWWLQQGDAARQAIANPGTERVSLTEGLRAFAAWLPKDAVVWGNGATFDNVVLSNAYRAINAPRPWGYRNDRCYRTLKNLLPGVAGPADEGVSHNALDDARWQAKHAVSLLRCYTVAAAA